MEPITLPQNKSRSFAALFIFLIPLFFTFLLPYGMPNGKVFLLYGTTYLFCITFAIKLFQEKVILSFRKRFFLISLIGLLAIHYLAAFTGINTGLSLWSEIYRNTGVFFITHLGILLFIWSELFTIADWGFIRRAAILGSTLFSFLYFFGPEGTNSLSILGAAYTQEGTTFGNSTLAAIYVVLAIVLTLIELSRTQKKSLIRKIFIIFLLIQILNPLFFNAALWQGSISLLSAIKNPYLFFGTAHTSAIVLYGFLGFLGLRGLIKKSIPEQYKNTTLKATSIIVGGIILLSLIGLFTPRSFIQNKYIELSTNARILIWGEAWQGVKEHPLLGYGPENFSYPHERFFNNELHIKANTGDIWYDKAHNFFFNKLIDIGFIGMLSIALSLFFYFRVFMRAKQNNLISTDEATLWILLPIVHILQLQTAFDAAGSYALQAVIIGYALTLEKKNVSTQIISLKINYITATSLLIITIFSGYFLFFKDIQRLSSIRVVYESNNGALRLNAINESTTNTSSLESIRLPSKEITDYMISALGNKTLTKAQLNQLLQELSLYENKYKIFISKHPENYRAYISYSYLLLVKGTLVDAKYFDESKKVIAKAYTLSPTSPLPYVIDAFASLYKKDLAEAKRIIENGVALNPNIIFTKQARDHIYAQEKTFPTVVFMPIENI